MEVLDLLPGVDLYINVSERMPNAEPQTPASLTSFLGAPSLEP